MKKLTYILAAAMAVYALNACGSRGHEAHSAVHSHDSEHNHTGHSHEHATHDHTDHNHSEEAHAPGIIEFSSEQADLPLTYSGKISRPMRFRLLPLLRG